MVNFNISPLNIGAWDLLSFFKNAKNYLEQLGGPILMIFGAALLIYSGFKIFKAITGRTGSEGPEWGKAIMALIFGGALLFGAYGLMKQVGHGGQDTISKLGGGFVDLPILNLVKIWL